jgi:conserved domain protein|nr:MAG TPA: leucine rich repeat protein [Caudoviricetes sp.]DAS18746.1 MAG TPA: leucine rich repeat protein [Caudoviricetes sp.]
MILFEKLLANVAKNPKFVHFEDPEVRRICIENWDKDGDGELSMEEAAAVSSIGTKFTNNKDIRDFKEFKFFKNIKVLGQVVGYYVSFSNCTNLSFIELPESLVKLSYQAFFNTGLKEITIPVNVKEIMGESIIRNKKLTAVILLPETPPKISNSSINSLNENLKYIYVPNSSFERYKQEYSSFWLAKLIRPLSEYHE